MGILSTDASVQRIVIERIFSIVNGFGMPRAVIFRIESGHSLILPGALRADVRAHYFLVNNTDPDVGQVSCDGHTGLYAFDIKHYSYLYPLGFTHFQDSAEAGPTGVR